MLQFMEEYLCFVEGKSWPCGWLFQWFHGFPQFTMSLLR